MSTSYFSVTISDSASLSDSIDLNEHMLVGIEVPSSWTTANITFQVANVGVSGAEGTFYDLYDQNGNEVTVTVAGTGSKAFTLVPANFAGFRFLKVRSGTTATPVAQSGDITLRLITRGA